MNVKNLRDLRELQVGDEGRRTILNYLFDSDVWYLACHVKAGKHSIWTGVLTDVEVLGSTKTIFGDLGGVLAQTLFQQEKFLVRQVYDVVHREDCMCPEDRNSSDWLMAEIGKGSFTPRITLHEAWGHVVDGNHGASSFYEVHQGAQAVELPVYVIR